MVNKKVLIIHSIGYPYGLAEDFLHNEVEVLSKSFEKIILVTRDVTSSDLRLLPKNCIIQRVDLKNKGISKLRAILNLFTIQFFKEFVRLLKYSKISKIAISTILMSIQNAKVLLRINNKIINDSACDEKLYFYSYWCDDAALSLALLRKNNKVDFKTFCRIHRWDVYFDQNSIEFIPFRKIIYDSLDVIYSISLDGINYVNENWGINNIGKVKLSRLGVYNSIDFKPKQQFDFLIVSCSNLIPVKNVHLLAEAISKLTTIRLKWVHFGDGPEKERIIKISEGFPTNISFIMKGAVKNEEIIEFYKLYSPDVFINVSSSEGVPVSIMEAMSFGIPVIATNVGGTSEIVNSDNGFLLNPNFNVSDLSHVIQSFYTSELKDYVYRQEQSFKTWKNEYNAEKNYYEFTQLLLNS